MRAAAIHGGAEQQLAIGDRLAGVEPDPHAQRQLRMRRAVLREGLLDGDRAGDGSRGRAEGGHQAVARVAHLGAAVGGERRADDRVVDA